MSILKLILHSLFAMNEGHQEPPSPDLPAFGDVSVIAHSDDPLTWNMGNALTQAIDYETLYRCSLQEASQRLKSIAIGHFPSGRSLCEIVSTKGLVCNCPTQVFPRPLKQQEIQEGSMITVGRFSSKLKRVLGRGTYGVVILVEDGPDSRKVAIKAQRPSGCLAHEYEIMQKIQERLGSRAHHSSKIAFPEALSFLTLADGAMMALSAGSTSGLNLVDLVNVYKLKFQKNVPEILALHYTARILCHLEALHWHAKILVSLR